jgi:hypothetical protein
MNEEENKETVVEVKEKPNLTLNYSVPEIISVEMSESIGELAAALAKAQGGMSNGPKDKDGYGYKYMTLGTLTDIVRPELASNELALIQSNQTVRYPTATTVVTYTILMHSSGQWIKTALELPTQKMKQLSGSQVIGVTSTYGRRYALQALCMICAEEDTDAAL